VAERCNTFWIGPALGPVERACALSVLRHGHPLTLYCYEEPKGVPAGVELADAAAILPRAWAEAHGGKPSFVANRFRYALQRLGRGIWLDSDVYLVAPLDFPPGHLFGWQSRQLINTAVFRTPPDSPLLAPLLALFDDREIPSWLSPSARLAARWRLWRTGRPGVAAMPWGTTGPHAVTALARDLGLDKEALPRDVFYPVHWRGANWIRDPTRRLEDVVTPRTVAIHLWNERIRPFKGAPARAGSFLARLCEEASRGESAPAPRPSGAAPPLSVVMPVHDGLPFVEESIASILGQSFGDFEFVIGDDGSTDGTSEALARCASRDSRIRLLRRDLKSGLAGGANWVIAEARAPLVAIAHADDLSHPDRLRRQIDLLRGEPGIDLVGTLWNGIDESGRQVRPADYWRLLRRSPFAPFSHSSAMFRRAAFEQAGGYRAEAEYWEDLDLYFRIAALGRVAVIPEVLATVRHAYVSTRLRNDPERVENAVDLMFRSTAVYRRGGDPSRLFADAGAPRARLHPMTFISCGSTRLWSGQSPAVLKRMRRRAGLGPNPASAHALVWVLWGTASPKSLRFFLRTLLRLRNLVARPLLRGRKFVEWRPRDRRQPAPDPSAQPAAEPGRFAVTK
jgi:GT2 family glycosyltransferase